MSEPHHRNVSALQRGRSKALRRTMTDAERKLWYLLRDRRFAAYKFRRQEALGPYILDFVCFSAKLVVEVDGGQHADNPSDAMRDAWLEGKGFEIARYWNTDVLRNSESVLLNILKRLERRR